MFSALYDSLLQHYEAGRFLEGYRESLAYWSRPELAEQLPPRELVLAARYAFRLGGGKYGCWMMRKAAAKYPDEPEVRYYSRNYMHRHRSAYEYLEFMEKQPSRFPERPDLQAYHDAALGHVWAQFRDFAQSRKYLAQAAAYNANDFWINTLRSDALLYEDRLDEALTLARQAWAAAPGQPAAACAVDSALCRLERFAEAGEFMSQALATCGGVEARLACCNRMIDLSYRSPDERTRWLEALRPIADVLEESAPLADRRMKTSFARIRLNAAMLADDFAAARKQVEVANHPFFRAVLEHQEQHPSGKRVILPHQPVRQDWHTCLPASIATVLSSFGESLTQQEIAADNTFSGTSIWRAGEWLSRRGYAVTQFVFSRESALRLIDCGIPFVLHETYDLNSHSVAVVGYDSRLGLLLIHDPGFSRLREHLLEHVGRDESPIGPFCTAILPPGRTLPELPAADRYAAEKYQEYFQADELRGSAAAGAVVEEYAQAYPGHPVCEYLRTVLMVRSGQGRKAYELLRRQYRDHPGCVCFRNLLLSVCQELQSRAESREILSSLVWRKRFPDQTSESGLETVPPSYLCDYADSLRDSHDTLTQAEKIVRKVFRQASKYAKSYHILSDVYLSRGDHPARVLPSRIAALLEPSDTHFAWSCFDALRRAGRLEEGLAFLRSATEEWGRHTRGGEIWNLYVGQLEYVGRPAEAEAEISQSLSLFPDDPARLEFATGLFARLGRWDKAEDCLARLERHGNRNQFFSAATDYHYNRGEWRKALELATEWVKLEPGNYAAKRELLRLTLHAGGAAAALRLAREWRQQAPDNETLEDLLLTELDRSDKTAERLDLLRLRVQRNRNDAWAWRGLGFQSLSLAAKEKGAKRESLLAEAAQAREECRRTCPGWPAAVMDAMREELNSDYAAAVAFYSCALDDYPDYPYAYRQTCELSRYLPPEEQRCVLDRLLEHSLRTDRDFDFDYVYTAAARLGVRAGLAYLDRLEERFPNNPTLLELRAGVLLSYGRGTSAADLPECDPAAITEYLRKAVLLHPARGELRLLLARALNLRNLTAEGLEVLEKHLAQNPMDATARRLLCDLLENAGRRKDAESLFAQSLELFPSDPARPDDFAGFLLRSGEPGRAVEVILAAHEKMPENIWLYERAGYYLGQTRDFAKAAELALRGTEIYPDGAYMWLLYANALENAGGDPEEVYQTLRKSLALNPDLFDTADRLAIFLAERKRHDEALETIEPFLADPDVSVQASGRKAWLLREKGETAAAYELLDAALDRYPGYAWGWSIFIEWVTADQEHDRARRRLTAMPAAMRFHDRFRCDRLRLLEELSVPREQLVQEWQELLADFPDSEHLHLIGFDFFTKIEKNDTARKLLDHIESRYPHDPYVSARRIALLAACGKKDEALLRALELWTSAGDQSNWPETHAWEAVRKQEWLGDATRILADLLQDGKFVRPRTLYLLMAALGQETQKNVLRQAAAGLNRRLPLFNKKEWLLDRLLRCQTSGPNYPVGLEASLDALYHNKMQNLALKFYRKNPAVYRDNAELIGSAVMALTDLNRWNEVYKILRRWRELRGLKMWLACDYIIAEKRLGFNFGAGRRLRRDVIDLCHHMLLTCPHDNTAWFMVSELLERHLLSKDYAAFCSDYDRFSYYASRKPSKEDWHSSESCWNSGALKSLYELINCRDQQQADKIVRHLANLTAEQYRPRIERFVIPILKLGKLTYRKPKLRKTAKAAGNTNIRKQDHSWGWVILAVAATQLLRSCSEGHSHSHADTPKVRLQTPQAKQNVKLQELLDSYQRKP